MQIEVHHAVHCMQNIAENPLLVAPSRPVYYPAVRVSSSPSIL